MSGNFERVTPQETTSQPIDGIGYGRSVQILARRGRSLLLWVPGQSVWNGTGQPWRYAPAHLMIHLGHGRYRRLGSGRLKTRLVADAGAIDEHFGEGFSKLVEPGTTVVVGESS